MFGKVKEKLASEAVQKSLGTISELAKKHLGPALDDIVKDDKKLGVALTQVYANLPGAVTSVCSQELFVSLCLQHKDKLFKKTAA